MNLTRAGFEEHELDGGGSDRLVDALVAWGGLDVLVQRALDHLAAGATHVCLQALDPDHPNRPNLALLEALAPRLTRA